MATPLTRQAALLLRCCAWVWLLVVAAGCPPSNTNTLKNFDKQVWLDNAGNQAKDNPRASMISELIDEVLTEGMSREAVTDLLGEPDSRRGNRELYDIGRSPYGIDLEYLAIDYEEGKLKKAFLMRG